MPWYSGYIVLIITLAVLAAISYRLGKLSELIVSYVVLFVRAEWVWAIGAGVCTMLLCIYGSTGGIPQPLAFVAFLIAYINVGMQFIYWIALYSETNVKTISAIMLLSSALTSVAIAILAFLPQVLAYSLVSTLPLCSCWWLQASRIKALPASSQPDIFSPKDLSSMWRIWMVLGGTTFILGVLVNVEYSEFLQPSPIGIVLQEGVIVVLYAVLLLLVVKRGGFTSFSALWRVVMVIAGALVAGMYFAPTSSIIQTLVTIFTRVNRTFLLVTLCDIANRTAMNQLNSHTALSIEVAAYYAVIVLASLIGQVIPYGEVHANVLIIMMFLLILLAASSWGASDLAMRTLFEEVGFLADPARVPSPDKAAELARKRFGLTNREVDIAKLLYEGRSHAFISESLFISENTVKTHVSHIYEKTGVHSKKQLQELLGSLKSES